MREVFKVLGFGIPNYKNRKKPQSQSTIFSQKN